MYTIYINEVSHYGAFSNPQSHSSWVHISPQDPVFKYKIRVIKSRRMRWAGHIARMEEGRCAFQILTCTPTGKGTLGMPRCRWEDNIKTDKEIGINTRN